MRETQYRAWRESERREVLDRMGKASTAILQGKTLIEASAHKVSPKDVLVDILCSGDPLRTSEKVQGNEKPSVCRGKVGDAPGVDRNRQA